MIQSSVIKGHVSVRRCCQFMFEVASELNLQSSQRKVLPVLTLEDIMIDGSHFSPSNDDQSKLFSNRFDMIPAQHETISQEDSVWNLAALTMELYLGYPIFNGEGMKAQKAGTPIPSIPNKEAKGLNLILAKCLSHAKSSRPSLQDVITMTSNELDRLPEEKRMPRNMGDSKKRENQNNIDRMWPDEFRKSMTVLLFLLFSLPLAAQSILRDKGETELANVLDAVLTIKKGGESNWNVAKTALAKHSGDFTLMDELKDKAHDCVMISSQVKSLGVNRMMNDIKRTNSVQNTGKDLLDGSDPRFNYSIYEKGIRGNVTATYTMTGRSGKQVFMVIPYAVGQEYATTIRINGKSYAPTSKDKNGISYFFLDKGIVGNQELTLMIENKESLNASFVIANHNYRDTK